MDIISDNDKFIIFYIVITYAIDMRSVMTFSLISKMSLSVVSNHFKQFMIDYIKNKKMFNNFHDCLSIPVHIWYSLLKKMKIDDHECLMHYDNISFNNQSLLNNINYDNNYWPIRKMLIDIKTNLFEDILKMRELRSIKTFFNIPHSQYLDNINQCNNLTHLRLYTCDLNWFPLVICDLKNLKELLISTFNFTSIPNDLINLINLETFALFHGKAFTKFPRIICDVKSLRRLTIEDCYVATIPNKIYKLQKLEYLNMKNNDLKTFPSSVTNMPKLKTIKLQNNKFATFPDTFQQIILAPDTKIKMDYNRLAHITTKYVFTKSQIFDIILKVLYYSYVINITSWVVVSIKERHFVEYQSYHFDINYLINPYVFNEKTMRIIINKNSDVYNDMHNMIIALLRSLATASW